MLFSFSKNAGPVVGWVDYEDMIEWRFDIKRLTFRGRKLYSTDLPGFFDVVRLDDADFSTKQFRCCRDWINSDGHSGGNECAPRYCHAISP